MAGVGVKINLEKNEFPRLAARLGSALDALKMEAAERVLATAQTLAPVDTGALKASLRIVRKGKGTLWVAAGSDEVVYAAYVEYGRKGGTIGKRPYLKPARDAQVEWWKAELQRLEARLR